MASAGGRTRGWLGWALGVLAALTLVLAAPQHVLDFDEAAGPVAAVAAHGHARTLIDHGQPGHACAGHCAAHVFGELPLASVLAAPSPRPLAWTAPEPADARPGPTFQFERPPKA